MVITMSMGERLYTGNGLGVIAHSNHRKRTVSVNGKVGLPGRNVSSGRTAGSLRVLQQVYPIHLHSPWPLHLKQPHSHQQHSQDPFLISHPPLLPTGQQHIFHKLHLRSWSLLLTSSAILLFLSTSRSSLVILLTLSRLIFWKILSSTDYSFCSCLRIAISQSCPWR